MKRFYMFLAFVLALVGGTGAAQAAPCLWSFDAGKPGEQTVTQGETKRVIVQVEAQGVFKIPEGWTLDGGFEAGACIGFDHPDTCGRWVAIRKFDNVTVADHPESASFAVENAKCSPSAQVFTITVKPAATGGVPWSAEEKSKVTTHVENATDDNAGTGDLGLGLVWGPNLDTTTRPAWGFNIEVGLRLSPHFKLGGAVRTQWTGIPIDPALLPQVIGTTEFSHFELIRVLGVITPSDGFHVELGGEAGVGTFSYSQTFIRQSAVNQRTEWVAEDVQTTPVIGPTGALVFYPGKHVRLSFGGGALFTMMGVRRTVGSGPGGTGPADSSGGKKTQAIPQLVFGIGYAF